MGANAQTAVPAFTAGQVLTAAQQTQINTGVPVFATTVTRDAAFDGAGEKVLAEGQFAYIEATNTTQYYDGAAWQSLTAGARIGQVVSTSKVDAFTTTSTSYTDVTGLSVSITPTLASSKVLVMVTLQGSQGTTTDGMFRLLRDSTAISVGTAGTTLNGFAQVSYDYKNSMFSCSLTFLDSPATTSATTYKVQAVTGAGGTICVNRRGLDLQFGGASSITVLEVIV